MIGVIAAREWRGLFLSPLAWTLLAVTQALLAWIFTRACCWPRPACSSQMVAESAWMPVCPGVSKVRVMPEGCCWG